MSLVGERYEVIIRKCHLTISYSQRAISQNMRQTFDKAKLLTEKICGHNLLTRDIY